MKMKYKTRVALVLVVLIAVISVIYQKKFRQNRREHKCKGTKPKSAEPSSSRHPPDTEISLPPSPSILHVFSDAAVCSDSDICSKIGRDILQRRGNAVDSALATLACNGLLTMQSMGIGGGFIMNIFKNLENSSHTIIARERAPLGITLDSFCSADLLNSHLEGPKSIAVPGEVMGYAMAHEKFGSMPWSQIIQPTIEICQKGFQLSKHQWDSLFFNSRVLKDPYLREMFVNRTTGGFIRVGSMVHPPPQLCETYKTLAKNGPRDFYEGELAELVTQDLKDIGSMIKLQDLRSYEAHLYTSIKMTIGPDVFHLPPPVGSGAVVGHVLNILKGYDFREKVSAATFTHRIIEALKFGFAKRWELGDLPVFHSLKIVSNMTDSEWGEQLRLNIDDKLTRNDPRFYGGRFAAVDEHGTGHISVLAPNGDAVSVTSSIHYYFGSAYMGKRTGILFNSAMGDFAIPCLPNYFSLPPSNANLAQPQKCPMSSMTPTIVSDLEGKVKLVVGGAGGPKIVSALVNILLRILWLGEDIKQAVDAPRFHHQLEPNTLEYEYGMLKDVVDGLEKIGHKTLRYRERGSVFCGIMKNSTAVYANVDFRKLGGVSGF